MSYNPSLPIIKSGWTGNPIDKKGRFCNHEFPHIPKFKDVWRWQTGPRPFKKEKKQDIWVPETMADSLFRRKNDDCIVWLGHAWFFIRLNGISMLIDPVLFQARFLRHRAKQPYPPHAFGEIDYILVSHDHRDHCDEKSLKRLMRLNPRATLITGLNMGNLLRKWGSNHIVEMGWYQQFHGFENIKITYLPTRHWSRRMLRDTNKRLWGAFVIESGTQSIYFGSDSGYGSHYAELKDLFPKLDYSMLGVGAFQPEWFMQPVHMSPAEAVQAFHDSGAKHLIPMHYGTLDLSDEPAGLPLRLLGEIHEQGKINGHLLLPKIGETMWV
jgi:L-ascorbate metabolism protein UlaG (beta-lactamase superfamily)